MKLTIERLAALSSQDLIDLGKIWPQQQPGDWQRWLSEGRALFGARFNERLLGAVKVELDGGSARLHDLQVRELTRRRGVGLYLIEDVQRQMPAVKHWRLSAAELPAEARDALGAFMLACGFTQQGEDWQKETPRV
ncbi:MULTISPECIES: aspartate 1-decarboxylase autocleavage activator PanM [Gibbsiella]|uniref:PanD regulatory factor n=1 Tax=Gibbsiella dentisursi TaxID=796890 RepID=A0ABP7M291_9GAMM|nr:aspartate 1-decarboxylase autocleavage activator PanM [Gibbsiella quercinecans]